MKDRVTSRGQVDETMATQIQEPQTIATTLTIPTRTGVRPSRGTEASWVNTLQDRWEGYRRSAFRKAEDSQNTTISSLLALSPEDLKRKMRFSKADIRAKILGRANQDYVREAYKYFIIGEEVGKDDTQGSILRISGEELLQLYVLVNSRVILSNEVGAVSAGARENPANFSRNDGLMRGRPRGGDPLTTGR